MQTERKPVQKFVPREKLSKKARRQLDLASRKDWGALNPVTRRPENPKAYNRKKVQKRWDASPFEPSFLPLFARAFVLFRLRTTHSSAPALKL